ncbi:MAG TPA: hypothetical protein VI818_04170 [Candidatus Thermoplasmatota archaeon]|nr:hypothetical protein [Candidatus Thermoplasmatota archaeon]
MKIDIGADGKILGTKRVSANGQISGFTEYAGAEVLVILPGGNLPIVHRDARDVLEEMEKVVEARMKLAFQEYKNLRQRFPSPQKATESFLRTVSPSNLRGVVDRAEEWVREQVAAVERRLRPEKPAAKKRKQS